jgi:hypothetical protein
MLARLISFAPQSLFAVDRFGPSVASDIVKETGILTDKEKLITWKTLDVTKIADACSKHIAKLAGAACYKTHAPSKFITSPSSPPIGPLCLNQEAWKVLIGIMTAGGGGGRGGGAAAVAPVGGSGAAAAATPVAATSAGADDDDADVDDDGDDDAADDRSSSDSDDGAGGGDRCGVDVATTAASKEILAQILIAVLACDISSLVVAQTADENSGFLEQHLERQDKLVERVVTKFLLVFPHEDILLEACNLAALKLIGGGSVNSGPARILTNAFRSFCGLPKLT